MCNRFLILLFLFFSFSNIHSQIVILGDNAPRHNINDGDFNAVWAYWRAQKQSPYWTTKIIKGKAPMGLHNGSLFSMNELGIAESVVLNTNQEYQNPKSGDVLNWSFGADLEYISNGTITLSLVFGKHERILAEKVKLKGSDKIIEHFKGNYTLTEEDEKAGLPFVRATFYSGEDVKVYLHYVNITILAPEKSGPKLIAKVSDKGIQLTWDDILSNEKSKFHVYRCKNERTGYVKLAETQKTFFTDEDLVNGIEYTYVVTRFDIKESSGSNKVRIKKTDKIAPVHPTEPKAAIFETEVKISWTKSKANDVASYSVYRGDANGNGLREIAHDVKKNFYVDFTPIKGVENSYVIYAHDHSGNKSKPSSMVKAKVKAVFGTSFSDLILPMPIHNKLTDNVWGAKGVIPRDADNGIEDSEWSYWGGRPVKDKDGKYHMCITRWPANATKGHWEWPNSTVSHVVSELPTGPYKIIDEFAYNYENGFGHNPDIILLNDGTYLLYSLINWEATLFTSKSMNGPWKRLGVVKVDTETSQDKPELNYRYYRNLSGVQLNDGRFLLVSKAGAMMISDTKNPLGPYKILTKPIQGNPIIPEKYRNSNYEDPVIWKDDVQFHMIINAFWDYRAIYLRSPDGINWKFNLGTAYTPDNTSYVDGTRTHWYKLERPHILQDEFGRATHLSLAVIDVPKANDLARDNHSSKNIVIPLTLHKRIKLLNKEKVTADTKKIKILILSENGFDAQKDIDLESLRIGASEVVNFGKGCKIVKTKCKRGNLMVEFDGSGNGLNKGNFTLKMIGETTKGDLIVGFTKLKGN